MHVVHWFLVVSVSWSPQYFDHSQFFFFLLITKFATGIFPPLMCAIPALRQTEHSSKNRGDPERARLIERPSLPRAAPCLPRLPPPSSTLPTAVRAGLRNLHTAHSAWAREKVRQRTLPSHTRPTHQAELSLLALTLRFSSPGQVRASRSSRSPTTLARRSKQPNPYPPSCGANHCPTCPLRHTFAEPRPVPAPSL